MIEFEVIGDPVGQGNLRAFEHKGRVITATSNAGKLSRWRTDVRAAFDGAILGHGSYQWPRRCPVDMVVEFRIRRPKGHYLPANRSRPAPELRLDAPTWHTGSPDLDKLTRAMFDALTLKAYADDALVVRVKAHKVYSERPGATVRISDAAAS
jgi:Holliday junction resolvase RusA-like endonuclease